jgi:hypothetical protein
MAVESGDPDGADRTEVQAERKMATPNATRSLDMSPPTKAIDFTLAALRHE